MLVCLKSRVVSTALGVSDYLLRSSSFGPAASLGLAMAGAGALTISSVVFFGATGPVLFMTLFEPAAIDVPVIVAWYW